MFDLANRIAVITGAFSGLEVQFAQAFFASELTGNFINDEIFLICKRLLPHGQGWPPGRIERSAYLSDLQ